jgi:hypothetical protein
MGKFEKNNKRYRTINRMAEDIADVLNLDNVSYAMKFDVIHGVTWQWTQRNGLYKGNQLWSKAAIDKYLTENTKELGKSFREEHIVPRSIIIDHLFNLKKPVQSEEVLNYLKKYLKSIVLTIEENRKINKKYRSTMPSNVDTSSDFDEWARYHDSLIEVEFVQWKKKGRSLIVDDILDFFELKNQTDMLYGNNL